MKYKQWPVVIVACAVAGTLSLASCSDNTPNQNVQGNGSQQSALQPGQRVGPVTVEGRITDVDPSSGRVNFESGSQAYKVQFPANSVTNLKKDEAIKVHLTYYPPGSAPEAADAPNIQGMQGTRTITGTVTEVNKDLRTIGLRNDDTTLELPFPQGPALSQLKEGDQIAVQVAFAAPGSGAPGAGGEPMPPQGNPGVAPQQGGAAAGTGMGTAPNEPGTAPGQPGTSDMHRDMNAQ